MTLLPLRTRLTLAYIAAMLVVLGVFGGIVLWQQERIGLRRVDRELVGLTATLSNVLRDELSENPTLARAAAEARNVVTAANRAVAIVDEHGVVLASRWNGFVLPAGTATNVSQVTTLDTPAGSWRVRTSAETFGATALTLLVAAPLTDVHRERREAQEAMMIGIPIILLLATGGGMYLASLSARPITSIVRATAEVTLSREHRDEAEYREALAIVGGQARRLGHLVEDMLVLARADAGGYPLRPVDLYLDEVVEECRRAVDVLAIERGVTIRAERSPEIPFRGDEDLLRQLVLNVLQNAVQHTPSGGSVAIDLHRDAGAVIVRVSDSGPGIPADDRHRIFDRFVQLDPSRRAEGTGLGLPIARWIAEAHRGTLVLERSGPDGTTFCVSLPM